MTSHLGTGTRTATFVLPIGVLAVVLMLLLASPTRANPIQEHILNAGINLGWAQATLELRGDDSPEDIETIAGSLDRAAQHIAAAAATFEEPYRTERSTWGTDERVIGLIDRYFEQAARLSIRERASRVQQIWSTYRQSFQTTWDSEQGFHYYPACDFFVLDVGYHFGRAQIAAGVEGDRARSYQQGANGGMRQAIEGGLEVAVDGYDYGPRTNTRKACCCFGKEAFWRELPTFQGSSPFALYAANLPVLQRIAFDAGVVPGPCTCGPSPTPTPTPTPSPDPTREPSPAPTLEPTPTPTPTPAPTPTPTPSPPPGCQQMFGTWIWFNGVEVAISDDGSFSSSAAVGGTWQCNPDGTITMTWDEGWIDTLSVSPDGASLSGHNQQGAVISATRMDPHHATAPASCGDEGMTVLYTLIDPPPYSGTSTICQSSTGGIWIQVGAMHEVLQIIEGEYDPETGCSWGSGVVTEGATYGGALCGA